MPVVLLIPTTVAVAVAVVVVVRVVGFIFLC
jgi:hypothetical protein